MKKLALMILLFGIADITAQNEQQAIELPDFVITGRQNVDLPPAKKNKPELISTLSKEFLLPTFSPEELPIFIESQPGSGFPKFFGSEILNSSRLKARIGQYTLPEVSLKLFQPFENYLFSANLFGVKNTEYLPNTNGYKFGGSLGHEFYISSASDFLPGTTFKLDAGYIKDLYHFYGSTDPTEQRETNTGNIRFSLVNQYTKWLNYGAVANGSIFQLIDSGLKETNINSTFFIKPIISDINLTAKLNFRNQKIIKNIVENNSSFLNLSVTSDWKIFDDLLIRGGVNYYKYDNGSKLLPTVALQYKFYKGLSSALEFTPNVEFQTTENFAAINPFVVMNTLNNSITKNNFYLSGIIKYEYERYFSITGFGQLYKSDDYPYFSDPLNQGKFDVVLSPNANKTKIGLAFNYLPTEYGYFFSEAAYSETTDGNSMAIPYEPEFSIYAEYGKLFSFGVGSSINISFVSGAYTNLTNTSKLESSLNLGASFYYEFIKNIKITVDFQNILNKSNFAWANYKKRPFDILAGIEYRW